MEQFKKEDGSFDLQGYMEELEQEHQRREDNNGMECIEVGGEVEWKEL